MTTRSGFSLEILSTNFSVDGRAMVLAAMDVDVAEEAVRVVARLQCDGIRLCDVDWFDGWIGKETQKETKGAWVSMVVNHSTLNCTALHYTSLSIETSKPSECKWNKVQLWQDRSIEGTNQIVGVSRLTGCTIRSSPNNPLTWEQRQPIAEPHKQESPRWQTPRYGTKSFCRRSLVCSIVIRSGLCLVSWRDVRKWDERRRQRYGFARLNLKLKS